MDEIILSGDGRFLYNVHLGCVMVNYKNGKASLMNGFGEI